MYRLRERSPSDLPNPIPAGCDREERRKRVENEGGIARERDRRREERLESEYEWKRRKEIYRARPARGGVADTLAF